MTITAQHGTRIPVMHFTPGMRLAAARKDADLTQERMAELLGVNRRTVVRWETDAVAAPPAVVIAYSVATDVNLGWIQSGTANEFTPEWEAWYLVRPKGLEPLTFWSVAAERAFWGLAA